MTESYVHGYVDRENQRLYDQASALSSLIHDGTRYPAGSHVLEVGCGVGAQTVRLADRSPDARFTAIDVSADTIAQAQKRVEAAGHANVEVRQADLFDLPVETSFDHIFVCFVLEHLERPLRALRHLRRVLRPGGTITVVEGDHGSAYFHPESADAQSVIECLIELQRRGGGNPLIGRHVYPLLQRAGFDTPNVSPRTMYVGGSRPDLAEAFTLQTFTAMMEGVRDRTLNADLIDAETFDAGIRDLRRTAEPDGVFCYTFFKGVAEKTAERDDA